MYRASVVYRSNDLESKIRKGLKIFIISKEKIKLRGDKNE